MKHRELNMRRSTKRGDDRRIMVVTSHRAAGRGSTMDQGIRFDDERSDGSAVATVMGDIAVSFEPSGLISIDGPGGGGTQFEFDGVAVLVAMHTEVVQGLRGRGY